MPMFETALPVGAKAIKAVKAGKSYPIESGEATFTRAGKDGSEIVLPLCGGCEFVGEVLPGEFKKWWDANIDTFTARINGGVLEMGGKAKVAGTAGQGAIDGHHPIPLLDEIEVTIQLEMPTSDTGATADRDIGFGFYLAEKTTINPNTQNLIRIIAECNKDGLLYRIQYVIAGSWDNFFSGSDYQHGSSRSESAEIFTIWRLVFHDAHAGMNYRHMHVYLKQGPTREDCEGATENELTNSPYDLSGFLLNVVYPAYYLSTKDDTYFGNAIGSGNEAKSTYLRVEYPPGFDIVYEQAEADHHKVDVEIWDGDPDAGGQRVADEDHEFSSDIYIQNGLVRLVIDEGQSIGFDFYYWTGAAWDIPCDIFKLYLESDAKNCIYPDLIKIVNRSPEKAVVKIRFQDTSSEDDDYYVDVEVTIKRGKRIIEIDFKEVYPHQHITTIWYDSPKMRWAYAGDGQIADEDLDITANNPTMTDNFMMMFDDAGDAVLAFEFLNMKPAAHYQRFHAYDGGSIYFQSIDYPDIEDTKMFMGLTPFSLVANLFEEAEDATLGGGATAEADGAASGGQAAKLDAQNESCIYTLNNVLSLLPVGRYKISLRVRDTNQVPYDFGIDVYNYTDSKFLNQDGKIEYPTLTASYAYYSMIFDLTDAESGDNCGVRTRKAKADANEIWIDYFLIVPIGNGEDWPQDQAHSAMRGKVQARRLYVK